METPPELEAVAGEQEDVTITTRSYDEEQIIAVDFGPTGGEPSLDIIDGTAIIVVESKDPSRSDDADQFEFDIPADANEVTVNDGILTIKS